MPDLIDQASAVTAIHNAIRVTGPDAVVFNPAASPVDLLAYAQGQMTILSEMLLALQDADETALPYALRSVLELATAAVELAASRLLKEARHG
ncbi:hypothetical protein [Roseateles asaccharophilus]|uniref:DUF3077 domain-containing protein n=1 Tax=Roseateles asaccharophilus TaxID=582607 RepID=A0ABU2A466_9BURK|nr:hypothetical protein [Roseateles asaccharophilus]MDR7331987.1 hypothetical protein [Roseateles asaccharophilus]